MLESYDIPAQMSAQYHFDAGAIESHSYLLPALRAVTRSVSADARAVDLGCGTGELLANLKQPGWHAHAVDLSASGIAEGRRRYSDIVFFQQPFDDALVAALGPNRFDLVISTEVIEHLYRPRDLGDTAFKLLKPGGLFVVSTPYHGYLKNLALAVANKWDKHFGVHMDCGHIKFFSYKTLSNLLREAGFVEISFLGAGRWPWLWKSMLVSGVKSK